MREINEVTREVVDASYKLHSRLGPGLMESAYRLILTRDLESRGLQVEQERQITITYEGLLIPNAFRVDLLVEKCVVAELKALDRLAPVHNQADSYVPPASRPADWTSHQLRSGSDEGRTAARREQAILPR